MEMKMYKSLLTNKYLTFKFPKLKTRQAMTDNMNSSFYHLEELGLLSGEQPH